MTRMSHTADAPDTVTPDPLASASPSREPGRGAPRGLLVDWGGVLTDPLDEAMTAWAARDGVAFTHFSEVMARWVGPRSVGEGDPDVGGPDVGGPGIADPVVAGPVVGGAGLPSEGDEDSPVHALERGEMDREEFEVLLAAALTERGSPVVSTGLLDRLLGGLERCSEEMSELVRCARRAGVRTALLSNSWGDHYPERLWDGLFDEIVISGRVGMRKPEPRIYLHTASLLGLEPSECVMVDDLPANIRAARALGMHGVLFRSFAQTAEELERILGVRLRQGR